MAWFPSGFSFAVQPSSCVFGLLSAESKRLNKWQKGVIFMFSKAFVPLYLIQKNSCCLFLLLIACLDLQYLTVDADDKLKLACILLLPRKGGCFQLTNSFPERFQCMQSGSDFEEEVVNWLSRKGVACPLSSVFDWRFSVTISASRLGQATLRI